MNSHHIHQASSPPQTSTRTFPHLFDTFTVPLEDELSSIATLVGSAEAELAAVEEELTSTRRTVHKLSKRAVYLKTVIASHTGISSHLRLIPPEILLEIFKFALATSSQRNEPWNIACVCKKWRGVALANPSLWSHLKIFSVSRPNRSRLGLQLKRTADLDLHIWISKENLPHRDIANLMGLLSSHLHRCRFLAIPYILLSHLDGPFPRLKQCEVSKCLTSIPPSKTPFKDVEGIREVKVDYFVGRLGRSFPWNHLTVLEVGCVHDFEDFISVLGALEKTVKKLSLRFGSAHRVTSSSATKQCFNMCVLASMTIESVEDSVYGPFLRRMTAPALQTLSLSAPCSSQLDNVLTDFVKESSCCLTSLLLRVVDAPMTGSKRMTQVGKAPFGLGRFLSDPTVANNVHSLTITGAVDLEDALTTIMRSIRREEKSYELRHALGALTSPPILYPNLRRLLLLEQIRVSKSSLQSFVSDTLGTRHAYWSHYVGNLKFLRIEGVLVLDDDGKEERIEKEYSGPAEIQGMLSLT